MLVDIGYIHNLKGNVGSSDKLIHVQLPKSQNRCVTYVNGKSLRTLMMCVVFGHRWTKAHTLLVQQKIKKDLLAIVVRESDAMLR